MSSSFDAALEDLPLFPLPGVVLFPKTTLPLHVFEPRYRRMLADCLKTHRSMAVVLVPSPEPVDEHGHPSIAAIAGAGVVVEHQPLPDGRANILLVAEARVALEELPFEPPYRRARATRLEDVASPVPDADLAALAHAATAFALAVKRRDSRFSFELPRAASAGELADFCARQLLIDVAARQQVLETLDVAERVRFVTRELASQSIALGRPSTERLN